MDPAPGPRRGRVHRIQGARQLTIMHAHYRCVNLHARPSPGQRRPPEPAQNVYVIRRPARRMTTTPGPWP